MENKKMKLWKKILLVLLAIFILFLIYVIRNFIIISNIIDTSKEYSNKTNYIANVYSIQSDSINIMQSYNKDGKSLTFVRTDVTNSDSIRKLTLYKDSNETIGVIESDDKKVAMLNNNGISGIQVVTFESVADMNMLQKLLFSVITRISTEDCNNKECYYIEISNGWKLWLDKDNSTVLREINNGFVTERTYKFDIVKDEDIVKPDISDCEIQK